MKQFRDLIINILAEGESSDDRTGTGTFRIPGHIMQFDLKKGFPLITGKFTGFRLFAEEMLWMLKGQMDLRSLLQKNVHIWTEWGFNGYVRDLKSDDKLLQRFISNDKTLTEEELSYCKEEMNKFEELVLTDDSIASTYGDYRPCYGYQWRHFTSVDWKTKEVTEFDQIDWLIKEAKANPNSRRLIVSAWNPVHIKDMKLPPCHEQFQLLIINGELNLIMYQRSCDTFLGVPFNIGQYALLTHILANILDLEVGKFVHVLADAHIYKNHIDQVTEYLERPTHELPQLEIKRKLTSVDDLTIDDFVIHNYQHSGSIKAPVSI